MTRIVRLIQGTEEWHRHRMLHRNASESAAVLGVCPWLTPYQLWEVKTGRKAVEVTYPMKRGLELEPSARAAYESATGYIMEPVVMVNGDYSASLDGLLLDGSLCLEVKCPVSGQESETWKRVEAGQSPEHYELQVQHQLMVCRADACDLYVFDGKQGITLRILPNQTKQEQIRRAWDVFWEEHIVKDVPPALTPKDTLVRVDQAWASAAKAYLEAKERADAAAKSVEDAKANLVELTRHTTERGYGVSVCRFWKPKGTKEEVRVTVLKEEERCDAR